MPRCPWAKNPLAVAYHDREWGVPVHDDRVFFEFLILEAAQAGLSWDTILRKRERYRAVYAGFDPVRVARFDARKRAALMRDDGGADGAAIVRNRLKIEASVANAKAFLRVQKEFGSFDAYVWGFWERAAEAAEAAETARVATAAESAGATDGAARGTGGGGRTKARPIVNAWTDHKQVPATSAVSDALSKDLKRRGFRFVGSTICYAFMQATGLVNDHLVSCERHGECRERR